MKVGIAIGRHNHELIAVDGSAVIKRMLVANDYRGVEQICAEIGEREEISFLGNYRWGLPFACALEQKNRIPMYLRLSVERGKRGAAGDVSKMLIRVLETSARPRPYFTRKTPSSPALDLTNIPENYRLSEEYLVLADNIRKLKHRLLNCLAIIFPEVCKAKTTYEIDAEGNKEELPVPEPQPPDIFASAKMRDVLEDPNPFRLAEDKDAPEAVQTLAAKTLGRVVPKEIFEKNLKEYGEHVAEYQIQVELKEEKLSALRERVAKHPLYTRFGGGDVITVLAGFLGWRTWPNWRELRRFCGLDVSRLDSKGKMRISRVRPHIRQYLYLYATKTTEGKALTSEVKRRVKKLERLLRRFWQECLRE